MTSQLHPDISPLPRCSALRLTTGFCQPDTVFLVFCCLRCLRGANLPVIVSPVQDGPARASCTTGWWSPSAHRWRKYRRSCHSYCSQSTGTSCHRTRTPLVLGHGFPADAFFQIYEQFFTPDTLGAGITIFPNALSALQMLGIEPTLIRATRVNKVRAPNLACVCLPLLTDI